MFDTTILTIFIPTIFVASITPSICMTLALSLGVKVGFRRTLWMIAGELVGVSGVFVICAFGSSPAASSSYIIFLGVACQRYCRFYTKNYQTFFCSLFLSGLGFFSSLNTRQ